MTRSDLARGAGSIARVMARDPQTHAELADVFILLTECLAATSAETAVPGAERSNGDQLGESKSDTNAHRFAALRRSLPASDPAEAVAVIRSRTGWSRSTYFRAQLRAKALGLIA